jgi:hypothetical protein
MKDLWAPVEATNYKTVPFVSGRLATEEDVRSGAAVFFLQPPNEPKTRAVPHGLNLPAPAIHKDGIIETPIVIIQAEFADNKVILGARPLKGGNMACLLSECELVEPTDSRFCRPK